MKRDHDEVVEERLQMVIDLLRHLVALELSRRGVKQTTIGKHLHIATAKVGTLLQGTSNEKLR